MRILLITGLTSYGVGGARAEAVRLLRGIVKAGHTAGLCADRLPDLAPAGVQHFHTTYPFQRIVRKQLARAVEQFRPDVVHAVGGGIRFLRAAEAVLRNTPWALTVHNVPPAERIVPALFDHPRVHRLVRGVITAPSIFAWRAFLRRKNAEVVICHSRRVEHEIRTAGHVDAVEVIPLGSEPSPTRDVAHPSASNFSPDAFPKLLSIGGLAPHKGQLELVRAIAQLVPSLPNLVCVIVGSHRSRRYREHLKKTIKTLHLDRNVQLVGVANEARKVAALEQADIYVQPSREEGFCLAFLEAATVASKIVGADTGAISEVAARHPAAIVVPPGDIAGLAAAIKRSTERIAPSETELQQSREDLLAAFSWQDHLRRHLTLYKRLHASGNHSSSEGTR